MWSLTVKEKEAVLKLTPFKRYTYTIKRIADTEEVYSLRHEDGTWALAELDNQALLPIWPHDEFAKSAIESEWVDHQVCKMPLSEFVDSVLPSLDATLLLNVFGIESRSGFVVSQQEFLRDLDEELSKY